MKPYFSAALLSLLRSSQGMLPPYPLSVGPRIYWLIKGVKELLEFLEPEQILHSNEPPLSNIQHEEQTHRLKHKP